MDSREETYALLFRAFGKDCSKQMSERQVSVIVMNLTGIKLVYPWHEQDKEPFKRYAPHQPVEDSYAGQWYRITLGETQYELRPVQAHIGNSELAPTQSHYFISAWNPDGAATDFEANQNLHARLGRVLSDMGVDATEAVTFSEDSSWFEAAWCVRGLDDDAARFLASNFRQLALVRWDATALTVIALDGRPIASTQHGWQLTKLAALPCPMKREDRNTQCTPEGGPWVARSQAIGAVWHEHRRTVLRLVGCEGCSSGTAALAGNNGTPITLRPLLMASRFGGYMWDESRWIEQP